jgi:uncharacterized damage-inducible protein DinB
MSIAENIIAEIEQEAAITKRLFERVPEDKMDWKPHDKSRSLGQLAMHIASVPAGVTSLATPDTCEVPKFENETSAKSCQELIQTLDDGISSAKEALSKMSDERMSAMLKFTADGNTVMEVPRAAFLRSVLLNHNYHHRGQLSVYLRLLDVPLPSIYGPSADENPFLPK